MALGFVLQVGDIVEAVVRCDSVDVQAGENVLHYVASAGVGTGVSAAGLVTNLDAAFRALYLACMENTAVYSYVQVTRVFPLPRSVSVRSLVAASNGAAGVGLLPEQCAGLIKKQTNSGGRHGRGRAYIPFPTDIDSTVTGVPTAAYLIRLNALAVALSSVVPVVEGGNSISFTPCLLNRKPPVTLSSTTPVLNALAENGWATQRRRSFYGRHNPPS